MEDDRERVPIKPVNSINNSTFQAVDEATARRIDAKKSEEEKKTATVGSKMESVGTRNVEKRYFTTKSGKRIILRPKTAVDDGKKGEQFSKLFMLVCEFSFAEAPVNFINDVLFAFVRKIATVKA